MRRSLRIIFLALAILSVTRSWSQDVPLFTQKLTNSFLYNPAVAGNSLGSLTLSHRRLWSGVLDAPSTNFFSVHTPFGNYKYGTGVNFYQDKNSSIQTLYASAAFAYHIHISDERIFSMGLSAEYNNQKNNPAGFDAVDLDDPFLSGSSSAVDFSFGLNYRSKFLILGASANRLRALTGITDTVSVFPAYYSGTARLRFPLRDDKDLFEPMVTFRGYAQGSSQIDAGLFYTMNNFITVGGSYRTGVGTVNLTAGVKVLKSVTIGYSRDMFMGDVAKGMGATNEFTIRFDFMDEAFYTRVKNAKVINTRALAVRRKSIATYKHRGSPYQQNSRYKKSIKKKSYMSPNYRMDASKKLQTVRRKSGGTSYKRSKPKSHRRKR